MRISQLHRKFVISKLRKECIYKIGDKSISWYKSKILYELYLNHFGTNYKTDYLSAEEVKSQIQLKYKELINNGENSGFIYVFANYFSGVCKIGFTTNPINRLKQVQTGCPYKLEIILVIKGSIKVERALHRKYKKFKTNGEWFLFRGELKESIQKIALTIQNIK